MRVTEGARLAAARLPKAAGLASSPATAAAGFTLVVGVGLLALYFSGTCLRQALQVARAQAKYGRVATEGEGGGRPKGRVAAAAAGRTRAKATPRGHVVELELDD